MKSLPPILTAFGILLLLICGYVLSVGPAIWLLDRDLIPESAMILWYPLGYLADAFGVFHYVYWYGDQWRISPGATAS